MSYRRRITKEDFLLGTSGIGFYARKGTIDFDNLKNRTKTKEAYRELLIECLTPC